MSRPSLALAIGISALVCGVAATAQDPALVTPVIELVGTSEIKEVKAHKVFRGGDAEWRPADPLTSRGLVISIKATFPADVTADVEPPAVTLSYSTSGTWHETSCLGVSASARPALEKGAGWFLRDARGECLWRVGSFGNTVEASFLFEVPPNISDVSFMYRGRAVLKELPLPWK